MGVIQGNINQALGIGSALLSQTPMAEQHKQDALVKTNLKRNEKTLDTIQNVIQDTKNNIKATFGDSKSPNLKARQGARELLKSDLKINQDIERDLLHQIANNELKLGRGEDYRWTQLGLHSQKASIAAYKSQLALNEKKELLQFQALRRTDMLQALKKEDN